MILAQDEDTTRGEVTEQMVSRVTNAGRAARRNAHRQVEYL